MGYLPIGAGIQRSEKRHTRRAHHPFDPVPTADGRGR